MYEIEHEMEMWAFGTGILGGHFLMIANLAYANMQLVKEEEKQRNMLRKHRAMMKVPNRVPFYFSDLIQVNKLTTNIIRFFLRFSIV